MKFKQFILPIILFILGIIFTFIGALFKIQHWPYGAVLLTLGTLIAVFGLIVLIVILTVYYFKK